MNAYLRVITTVTILAAFFCVYMQAIQPVVEPRWEVPPDIEKEWKLNQRLVPHFSPGDWELSPDNIVLEMDGGVFVFQDYDILDRQVIKVSVCTFVLFPEQKKKGAPAAVKKPGERPLAIIVRVPEGGELHLDAPINPMGGAWGSPVRGQLNGEVNIYSYGKTDAPDDDFRIHTRDVIYENGRILSQQGVEFYFGNHEGRGKDFVIVLDAPPASQSGSGIQFSGVSSFELKHLTYLRMRVPITPRMVKGFSGADSESAADADPREMSASMAGLFFTAAASSRQAAAPGAGSAAGVPDAGNALPEMFLPVKLTCLGPVFYDVGMGEASFTRDVRISWQYANNVEDSLVCDKLLFNLYPESEGGAGKSGEETSAVEESGGRMAGMGVTGNSVAALASTGAGEGSGAGGGISAEHESEDAKNADSPFSRLSPQRVTASGTDVVLTSRQFLVEARGSQLSVNIPQKTIMLESPREATLKRENQEFHARSIRFTQQENGLGRVNVIGSGWMQYRLEDENPETADTFRASWRTEFQMYPEVEDEYAVLLDGNATVDTEKFGKISSDKLYIWLKKKTPAEIILERSVRMFLAKTPQEGMQPGHGAEAGGAKKSDARMDYRLARVQALNNVEFQMKALTSVIEGKTALMELWFLSPLELQAKIQAGDIRLEDGRKTAFGQNEAGQTPGAGAVSAEDAGSVYRMTAQSIKGNLIQLDSLIFVSRVLIEKGIEIQEFPRVPQLAEVPLYMRGEHVEFTDVTPATLQGKIIGQEARLKGRGVELTGSAINLNCRANRAWVEGPGTLKMYMRKNARGEVLDVPQGAEIRWADRMIFDGDAATFDGNVRVNHPEHRVLAQHVEAVLKEKVLMSQPPEKKDVELARVSASGNVEAEDEFFKDGKRLARVRTSVQQITYFPATGEFTAPGAGKFLGTFESAEFFREKEKNGARAAGGDAAAPAGMLAAGAPAGRHPAGQGEMPSLYQVNVKFHEGAVGNALRKEVLLSGRTYTVADEVRDWGMALPEDVDPKDLGKYGFTLRSGQLRMNQAPEALAAAGSGEKDAFPVEFQAEEDVLVEMTTLSANAYRLNYSYVKDLMIMTGARVPVQIRFQETPGAPRRTMQAQKIEFHPSTKALSGDDIMTHGLF